VEILGYLEKKSRKMEEKNFNLIPISLKLVVTSMSKFSWSIPSIPTSVRPGEVSLSSVTL
jgi:hypothetical protein